MSRAPFWVAILFVGLIGTQAAVVLIVKAWHWWHP